MKKKTYVKIINKYAGHHGYHYKLGVNVDPLAIRIHIDKVGKCEPGAFYFITPDQIPYWLTWGKHVAILEPLSKVKADDGKFKAQHIRITKIISIREAFKRFKLSLLNLPGASISEILADKNTSTERKLKYVLNFGKKEQMIKTLIVYPIPIYKWNYLLYPSEEFYYISKLLSKKRPDIVFEIWKATLPAGFDLDHPRQAKQYREWCKQNRRRK
jgi:hypothetical protein